MVSLVKESSIIAGFLGAKTDKQKKSTHNLLEKMVYYRREVDFNFTIKNKIITSQFNLFREGFYKEHIYHTRRSILHGAAHLKGTETIVVLGPGEIEPLKELLEKCHQLILIGFDGQYLNDKAKELNSKKVKVMIADFSGGLCEAAQALINKTEQNLSKDIMTARHNFYKDFFDLYENFKHYDSCLKIQADYVISSLVSSQLLSPLDGVIVEFAERVLGLFVDNLPRESEYGSRYRLLRVRLESSLLEKHMRDLQSWVKPRGRIFFSDTTVLRTMAPTTSKPSLEVAIEKEFLSEIEHHFSIIEKRQWKWFCMPLSGTGYDIQAYLMTVKQNHSSDCFKVPSWHISPTMM